MVAIVYMLFFLLRLTVIVVLISVPILPGLAYHFLRKRFPAHRHILLAGVAGIYCLMIWPISGLFELKDRCSTASIEIPTAEKVGPVSALLIDGAGMWWLHGRITIERPHYSKPNTYNRSEISATDKDKSRIREVAAKDLQSIYQVTIVSPKNGNYLNRYFSTASISIEERNNGMLLARAIEPAWGGGLAGLYVGIFSDGNPFQSRYFSCGYAGQDIGPFRGVGKERHDLYQIADRSLIERVFVIPAASSQ
ncbi:MAG: hypothetical protein KJZ92_02500 [Rhodocyclaceae bacterium]|jgi:hypothetical protein|nr:hypothetical protein [Rhodocyclaceae bacterium]MCL4680117.1 hypothetical protein [Rhodocyclaceae bacterium]